MFKSQTSSRGGKTFKYRIFTRDGKYCIQIGKESIEDEFHLTQVIIIDIHRYISLRLLYKAGDKNVFNNYRPVSLLPQYSKVLEKLFNVKT